MDSKINNSKQNLALLFGGFAIITLLFLAYNNFKKPLDSLGTGGQDKSVLEQLMDKLNGTQEPKGEIDQLAAQDVRLDPPTVAGSNTQIPNNWVATDYKAGEIQTGSYIVKTGDTLWEIAEAVYGNGNEWHKILEANKSSIGFLANGSQALIVTGQSLIIP